MAWIGIEVKIRSEERLLLATFPDAYRAYRERVPRLIPGWRPAGRAVILSKVRDPRLITIRRGGTLADADHHQLAVWAADCAEHVLHLFEQERPDDGRPRRAIEHARAWARGEVRMTEARAAGGHAMAAARDLRGPRAMPRTPPARPASSPTSLRTSSARLPMRSGRLGRPRHKATLTTPDGASAGGSANGSPGDPRAVVDDQRIRNDLCWSVFDC